MTDFLDKYEVDQALDENGDPTWDSPCPVRGTVYDDPRLSDNAKEVLDYMINSGKIKVMSRGN